MALQVCNRANTADIKRVFASMLCGASRIIQLRMSCYVPRCSVCWQTRADRHEDCARRGWLSLKIYGNFTSPSTTSPRIAVWRALVFVIDVKKRFLRFLFLSRFYVFNVFFNFPYLFKIKNVENWLSVQANSEIFVLHLTNDRPNCSGLLLLSTFFVSCWAYYMRVGI